MLLPRKVLYIIAIYILPLLVATHGSNSEGISEIMDQSTKDISVIKNIETTPVPFIEKIIKIIHIITKIVHIIKEPFNVSEHLDATPLSNIGVDETLVPKENTTNIMSDKEIDNNSENEVENEMSKVMNGGTQILAVIHGSDSEGINEIMDQTTEDIGVIENIETTPVPFIEKIGKITHVIAEIVRIIKEPSNVTEHLDATLVSSIGVDEIYVPKENTTNIMSDKDIDNNSENEVENENSKVMNGGTQISAVVHGSDSEGINEIMDQITEYTSVIENIETTTTPFIEKIGKITHVIAEIFRIIKEPSNVTEHLDATLVSSIGVDETHVPKENSTNIMFDEEIDNDNENEVENKMSKIINGKTKISAAVHGSNSKGIDEIMDQTTGDISVIGNIETTPVPFIEKIDEIIHIIAEIVHIIKEPFNATEHLDASLVSSIDANETHVRKENTTNIMFDKEFNNNNENEAENKMSKIMNGKTQISTVVHGSNSEGIDEIMDQTTEDISVIENMETIPVPFIEKIGKIIHVIAEIVHIIKKPFNVTEHLNATPVSSIGVDEIHVPKENTTTSSTTCISGLR